MSVTEKQFLQEGERFRGYVVQKRLGSGGAGAVYLVRHEVLDTLFALKVLDPSTVADDSSYLKRFLREARLATRIRHPNLVAVHDCGHDSDKDLYYLIMDYVPGGSLRDVLAIEGKLPVARAADIVAQVASALDAAQAFQVVHRDIKPENIMVQPDGRVKLVDLGIAKAQNLGDSLRTNTDSIFGTPSYVSPEQAQCSSDVDLRADIYSLGVVFFEMLTGRCPYVGRNPAQLIAQILSDDPIPDVRDFDKNTSPDLAILIRRMTVKDRVRRLDSFASILDELAKQGLLNRSELEQTVEYAAEPAPGMKTLLAGLDKPVSSKADPLANSDEDVQSFMKERTRRQARRLRQRRILLLLLPILLIILISVLLAIR